MFFYSQEINSEVLIQNKESSRLSNLILTY